MGGKKTFIVIFSCLGDEITDLLYIITNWYTFGNDHLRNASVFFFCVNFFINFVLGVYLMTCARGIKQNCRSPCFICTFICCCWWIPVASVVTFLLWTKIFDLVEHCNMTRALFDFSDARLEMFGILKAMSMVEMFVEDIPEIIIQSINNQMTQSWSVLDYISLAFSVLALLVGIYMFTFKKDSDDIVHPQRSSEELSGYLSSRFKNTNYGRRSYGNTSYYGN